MSSFSAHARLLHLEEASRTPVDLIIIGGGITGAGIALDARLRGLSVVLVEKNDFASGTSSRSTKLIHGGLRYLKQLDFALVREVGKERAIAFANAPHLVLPEPMLLPVIKGGSLGKFSTAVGLWLYEALAGVKSHERRKMLDKAGTLRQEPLLSESLLIGGALYSEYRTDDARLTIEVLKSAADAGATLVNYCEATALLKEGGKIAGVMVTELISGKSFILKSTRVVNAGGPWVDQIRKLDGALSGKRLHLTKGVHIVVNRERLPVHQAAYFDAPDGRMIFAIPRGSITYIGTTDTNYAGSIEKPRVTAEDVTYLLDATNRLFAGNRLVITDVISSWWGLRPLIHEDGKDPSELSRKDELLVSDAGLISIAGGKLTGYRKMAQRVTDRVIKEIRMEEPGRTFKPCRTQNYKVSGGDFSSREEIFEYIVRQTGEASQIGVSALEIEKLVWKYGRNAETIIDFAYTAWNDDPDRSLLLKKSEIKYAINHEMAVHPADFWIRRTGALYFERPELASEFELLYPAFCAMSTLSETQAADFGYSFLGELDAALEFLSG